MYKNNHDEIATAAPNAGNNVFPAGTILTGTQSTGGDGYLGKVGGGCDYQFPGNTPFGSWLIGGFADYSWSNIRGQYSTNGFFFNDGSAESQVGQLKESSNWAVGARVGWVVVPRFMTYLNAGYTEAHFDGVSFSNVITPQIGANSMLNLPSQTYRGWFVGGGTEYALGLLPGLFLRSEYRYSQYDGKTTGTNCLGASVLNPGGGVATCAGVGPSGYADRSKIIDQRVTTELVYRFNWGGGVVARY
jgi:outer membrane immunogenic protein